MTDTNNQDTKDERADEEDQAAPVAEDPIERHRRLLAEDIKNRKTDVF